MVHGSQTRRARRPVLKTRVRIKLIQSTRLTCRLLWNEVRCNVFLGARLWTKTDILNVKLITQAVIRHKRSSESYKLNAVLYGMGGSPWGMTAKLGAPGSQLPVMNSLKKVVLIISRTSRLSCRCFAGLSIIYTWLKNIDLARCAELTGTTFVRTVTKSCSE